MSKQALFFQSPFLNAAGFLGFTPDLHAAKNGADSLRRLGAFITNPISLAPRQPAERRACLAFNGGFLLHTGLANPGLKAVLKRFVPRWAAAPIPVIPHLIADSPDEIGRMVQQLEGLENVIGVEISFPPNIDPALAAALVTRAAGELSVIACLPFESAPELAESLAHSAGGALSAVSLAAPRGLLPASGGSPTGPLVQGRLYGPGLLPAALKRVQDVAQCGLPVIGSGGIYRAQDVRAMQAAGAAAVELDGILWSVEGINSLARW